MKLTLSKAIIYGSDDDVIKFLEQERPKLDEIDEYGYTPLVQTAICDSVSKAKILLDAGASPNFSDLTGRTALHWAADNHNVLLCRLLLKRGANANAYTRAGQPVLVLPVLREQEDVKRVLYQYGADLNFARDFINAKAIGHRFELEGRVDLVDTSGKFFEIEFEGFFHEFCLAMVIRSLLDFKNNYGARRMRVFFPYLEIIIQSLQNAAKLNRFQHYLVNKDEHHAEIDRLLDHSPLVIPVSYDGHAISFIKYENWFVRVDRGAYGREHGTVIVYRMREPKLFSKDLFKYLLYKRQHREFIEGSFDEKLDLQVAFTIPLTPQISGNCAWSNLEATIPALMFLLLLVEARTTEKIIRPENYQRTAMRFYQFWQEWDKDRAFYFLLKGFDELDDAHKASRAAILAAIFFQQFKYEKEKDQKRADEILKILSNPKFEYILKSYVSVFGEDKKNPYTKNLFNFLEDYGFHWVKE